MLLAQLLPKPWQMFALLRSLMKDFGVWEWELNVLFFPETSWNMNSWSQHTFPLSFWQSEMSSDLENNSITAHSDDKWIFSMQQQTVFWDIGFLKYCWSSRVEHIHIYCTFAVAWHKPWCTPLNKLSACRVVMRIAKAVFVSLMVVMSVGGAKGEKWSVVSRSKWILLSWVYFIIKIVALSPVPAFL